jgi:NitT/TauT family transport system substrate-binding protein
MRIAQWMEERPEIAAAKLDLSAVYTNDFVKKANAKYPKA